MSRFVRIAVIGVGVFLVAWVLKEVLGVGDISKNPEELVERLRAHGV